MKEYEDLSEDELEEMHDLVTSIQIRQSQQEEDIRNLYNLIHVIKGDGIRLPEYRAPYSERRKPK